jgi:hypothetical protein
VLCQDDHRLAALKLRNRVRARDLEDRFDALGPEARQFHLELRRRPVKTAVHLRRILNLVRLYGRDDVRAALVLANQYGTYDAAYVETLVLQERRRRELPSPTPLCPKRIPKQKILRLFDCQFVEQHQSAVFIGPTGTGKTHLLNALAYTACEKGLSVHSTRVIDMINTLTTAQLKGTLEKTLKIYIRPALLLLDELGYLPIDRRGANLLFQVVAARYESGAIVLSTNRPLGDWGQTFDVDNTLATAMIDRLMHHGEPILIQGDSYRMKDKGNE